MDNRQDIGSGVSGNLFERLRSTTADGRSKCFCGYISKTGNPVLLKHHLQVEIKRSQNRGDRDNALKHRQFFSLFKGESQIREVFRSVQPDGHHQLFEGLDMTLATLAAFAKRTDLTDDGKVYNPWPEKTTAQLAEVILENARITKKRTTTSQGDMTSQSSPQEQNCVIRQHHSGGTKNTHGQQAHRQEPYGPPSTSRVAMTQSYGGNAVVRYQQNQRRPR